MTSDTAEDSRIAEGEVVSVLHVVGALNRAGTETWLIELFRQFQMMGGVENAVVVQLDAGTQGYGPELSSLGIDVDVIPRNLLWPWRFYGYLKKSPHLDVVHSHRNEFSAFVLFIAKAAGVRRRIAHSHNDHTTGESLLHRLYRHVSRWILERVATNRVAVSSQALDSLFGSNSPDAGIAYCGLDLQKYQFDEVDRKRLRLELGIPSGSPIFVHVGGLKRQKNHRFLLGVFAEYVRGFRRDAHLLLVGDGAMRQELVDHARHLQIDHAVHFLGVRRDVPAILSTADIFLFPSFHEGLSLALVEAQAAGLPIVISSTQSAEAIFVPELVFQLSLDQSPLHWANLLNRVLTSPPDRISVDQRLYPFSIEESAKSMRNLYVERESGSNTCITTQDLH